MSLWYRKAFSDLKISIMTYCKDSKERFRDIDDIEKEFELYIQKYLELLREYNQIKNINMEQNKILIDWIKFSRDIKCDDFAGKEWLNKLIEETKNVKEYIK